MLTPPVTEQVPPARFPLTAGTTNKSAPLVGAGRLADYVVWLRWAIVAVLGLAAGQGWATLIRAPIAWGTPGGDLELYRRAAARWLDGGSFYQPYQLAGPYDLNALPMPVLYPPPTLPLFAVFTVLPAILWWAIPLAIVGVTMVQLRPRPVYLAAIAAIAVWPGTIVTILWMGNPALWLVAALSLALAGHRWAGALILLKPTLLPFALVDVRSRAWWLAVVLLVAMSVLLLPLWVEYVTTLRNLQGGDWRYSAVQWPAMLIPVLAWFGRRRA